MRQYYFYYNGNTIMSGTILKFKPYCTDQFWKLYTEEVTFVWYEPNSGHYYIQVDNRYERMPREKFEHYFIGPTFKQNTRFMEIKEKQEEIPTMTFIEELQIDGMFLAWMWFVVLMGITLLFNGFYFYWAIIIILFVCYRNNKLNENNSKKRRY